MIKRRLAVAGQRVRFLGNLGLAPGALAGGLLTPPLVGLMYLLDPLAGMPFVPFALFDWITRVLPGPVVTFGIDLMIEGMLLVGMSVAAAAKTAEQIGAILLFFFLGVAAATLYFAILRFRNLDPQRNLGLVLGMLFGLPMVAVSLPMGQYTANPEVAGLVLLAR